LLVLAFTVEEFVRALLVAPLLVAPFLAGISTPARGQVNYDTVQVRATSLGRGVHVLFGAGGNIGLSVGDDAAFVVDDQFAPLTPKILAAIRAITTKPVKFVVNTHWHFDHTGGNENLGKAGALIVAHDNVRKRMSTEQFMAAMNRRVEASPREALPVVTFNDGVTFHINGDSVQVTHVPPAHTDGDALVHFLKANVIHMGDVFNNSGFPFVDLSSGGSVHGVIQAADRAYYLADEETRIVPGHGAVTDRRRLRQWRDAVAAVRDGVQREVRAGKSIEQILALNLAQPYAKEWPGGHERFIRTVHEEVTRR
jgi:glyoxylase-like metal-dependent hydrolase (beta-lactamase superfamily II)